MTAGEVMMMTMDGKVMKRHQLPRDLQVIPCVCELLLLCQLESLLRVFLKMPCSAQTPDLGMPHSTYRDYKEGKGGLGAACGVSPAHEVYWLGLGP